ncbi:MAG: helix-turn-helix domain-containing protein [Planctomycetes bacterium]|nr:helix-turn-helix domain-containing protein [Planctomycetota bacterium]
MKELSEHHELWTVAEFATYLRVTVGAARAMIRRSQVPTKAVVRIGRRIRLKSGEIRRWVDQRAA